MSSSRNFACISGSPPENVTPPPDCAMMSAFLRSSSASASAVQSRPHTTFSPPLLTIVSVSKVCPSGLWHQAHLSGHPLKNTVVLTPGPSCKANSLISKTLPTINLQLHPLYNLILVLLIELDEVSAPAPDSDNKVAVLFGMLLRI